MSAAWPLFWALVPLRGLGNGSSRRWKPLLISTTKRSLASDDAVTMLEDGVSNLMNGYALLGRFQIAAGKASDGDATAAESVYLAIAADASVDALYAMPRRSCLL